MCRCIIHDWRSWLHCILCTCSCHLIPFYYCSTCFCRRPHSFCLGHLQCLSEYHFTQPCRKSLYYITISIYGLVQHKMSKTSISLNKSEGVIHSGNKVNSRNKTCWKILVWLTKINPHHFNMIRSSSDNYVLLWIYNNYKPFLAVKTYYILMATENIIFFEIPTQ